MRLNLSIKILLPIFAMVIISSVLGYYISIKNTEKFAELVSEHTELVSNISVQEGVSALNDQAEQYLQYVAGITIARVRDYLEQRGRDVIPLSRIERTPDSFLSFSVNRKAKIHRRSDKAPVEGISFPNERDVNDVEEVPVFKRLIYIDENGMERIKIENDEIRTNLENVSETVYFRETSRLGKGDIYVLKKNYTIWDCTKRSSTLIGEQLYGDEGDCPHKGITPLNATGWRRFTDGYIRYSTPVYENNTFKGIVVADLDFLPVMKLVNDVKVGQTGYAYLEQTIMGTEEYERGEGITVAHPSHQFVLNMDPGSLYKLGATGLDDLRVLSQRQHRGGRGIGRYIFRGVDKYTSYAAMNESGVIWSIGVTSPVEEFTAPAKKVQIKTKEAVLATYSRMQKLTESSFSYYLFWSSVMVTVILLFIILLLSKTVILPIRRLRGGIGEISKGNLGYRLDIKTRDELEELAESFNQMAGDLKKYKSQIERHSEELEKEVQKRTKELGNKVEQLEDVKLATLNIMEDLDASNRQLREAEKQLKGSFKDLKRLDLEKDRFISIAAHELKTPMTSIKGFAQLLEDEKAIKDTETRKKYFDIIIREISRLSKMVTEVLDLSRVDLGTMKLVIEDVNMVQLLDEVKDEMLERAKEKGLALNFETDYALGTIKTDRERMKQILINLVDNAIKYTEKGSIKVAALREREYVKLSIADTGIGIPQKYFKKMFTRFYQVALPLTRKVSGTGLGLSICKEFVEGLGGKIWFESRVGRGSTFYFEIPLEPKKVIHT